MRGAIALGDGLKENATLTGLFLGCKNTSNRVFFESAFNFSFQQGTQRKMRMAMKTLRTLSLMKMIPQVMSFTVEFHGVVQTFWKKHGAFVKEVLLFKLKKKCFQGNSEQGIIHEKGTISSSPQEGINSSIHFFQSNDICLRHAHNVQKERGGDCCGMGRRQGV